MKRTRIILKSSKEIREYVELMKIATKDQLKKDRQAAADSWQRARDKWLG